MIRGGRGLIPILCALVLWAGCGQAAFVPRVSRTPGTLPGATRAVPLAITTELLSLRREYALGDWNAVQSGFSDPTAGARLVDVMRLWKEAGASTVRIELLSWVRRDARDYEVSVRFSDDPRAAPDDRFYTMRLTGTRAVISGTASGLSGRSYTTATWDVSSIAHFTVYHSPYQLAGPDRAVLTQLESQRTLVARKFRVTLPATANVYLFPNLQTMQALTRGTCGKGGEIGCTSPFTRPPSIETLRAAIFHEAIHVYQLAFVPPSPDRGRTVFVAPLFIAEGMAVALQNAQVNPSLSDYCALLAYRPLSFCARQSLQRVHPTTILADRGFLRALPSDAYAEGGAFVSYLIQAHGFLAFKKFYYVLAGQPQDRMSDYNVAARAAYGRDMSSLVRAWLHTLCASCKI